MSYEGFKARWRGWMGQPGGDATFYVAELTSGRIVGFASGGPRREEGYPEYDGELYAAYLLRKHQHRGLGRLISAVAVGLAAEGRLSMLGWVLAENPSWPFYEVVGGKLLASQEMEIGGVALEEVAYGWDDVRSLIVSD
jgi:GNAT superfamily N-acetyltransferase